MASRYIRDNVISGNKGKVLSSSKTSLFLRNAIEVGDLTVSELVLSEGQRLDTIAGQYLGDSSLWWVLAATSNIGWGLQVPSGTILMIPTDVEKVLDLVG